MKRFCCLFIFVFFSFCLFGFNGPNPDIFNMKISGEFGLINGTVDEYVFDESCKNTDNMLSRLNWDVLTIPYFEGDLTFNFIKYIYINANGRIGVPTESQFMQDYDWLNSTPPSGYSSWLNDDPTELTNYSIHNDQIDNYYKVSAKVGGNIPIGNKVVLSPYIGYEYDYIAMSAYDGYSIYKWHDFEKRYFSGKGISYAQEFNAMILGLNLTFDLIPYVPIQTYFHVIPAVGSLTALDLHHLPGDGAPYGRAFLDQYQNIFALEWKLAAFYEFNKHNRLGLTSFIQYMPLQKGITGQGPINENGSLPDQFQGHPGTLGGAGRFLYSFSVIYQFKL